MKQITSFLYLIILPLLSISCSSADPKEDNSKKTLVIIMDGLRKDYITEEIMPNLNAMQQTGAVSEAHHSVFPTVTRVNSTSYATGSYPKTHGILENSIYLPKVDSMHGVNTGNAEELINAEKIEKGGLLTQISFGEVVQENQFQYMVFSTGTTGQTFLLNHKVSGGGIINPDLILPETMAAELINSIGEIPEKAKPNKARHTWVTDAYIKYGLAEDGPIISTIWYSDPDGTAHSEGVGSPTTLDAIHHVDAQLGRIREMIFQKGLENKVNIVVSSDHGFVTHLGNPGLDNWLVEKGYKKKQDSDDIVVVKGAIYLKEYSNELCETLSEALQKEEWVGAIFTKAKSPQSMEGSIPGTLSFESIHFNHKDRVPDILVDVNWDDAPNEFGYKGSSNNNGTAGHGSSSPHEIQTPFIAVGPDFKKKFSSQTPSSMIDIMPTLLSIHNLEHPGEMDGRVLDEMLTASQKEGTPVSNSETIVVTNKLPWGTYELTLQRSSVGDRHYVDFTKTTRNRLSLREDL